MNTRYCIKATISLLLLISIFFIIPKVFATDILLDSYATGTTTVRLLQNIHPSGNYLISSEGQCFHHTQANNYYLKSAKFKLKRYGSPIGYLKAALYDITGICGSTGKPAGSALAVSSTSLSMATVSNRFLVQYTFDFDGSYQLVPNVYYVIQVYVYSATTIDTTNKIGVQYYGSGGDDGIRSYYNSGAWHYGTINHEIPFEVWGEAVPSGEWHDVVSWDFDLTTREWLTASTWNFNLSTRQWTDIVTWSFNLTTMAWQNIATWGMNLTTMAWHTITNWTFTLVTLGWHAIAYWTFTLTQRNAVSYVLLVLFASIILLPLLVVIEKKRRGET